jgi:peptidoglycan/LPS O-acetylase OafA/YrhL
VRRPGFVLPGVVKLHRALTVRSTFVAVRPALPPTGTAENHKERLPHRREHHRILDGVRASAILLVIAFHLVQPFPNLPLLSALNTLSGFGWAGVDLFFVLSGFLITGILWDTKNATNYFRSFFARRALRIFPLYYGVLAVLVTAALFSHEVRSKFAPQPIYNFLYINNWTDVFTPMDRLHFTGHFWSLAIEEQFYLLWPLCVWLVPDLRTLRNLCIGGAIIAAASRALLLSGNVPNHELIYKALFTRMDTLFIGALGAVLVRQNVKLNWRSARVIALWTGAGALAFVVPVLRHRVAVSHVDGYMQSIGFSFVALTFGFLVLWAYDHSGSSSLVPRLLQSEALVRFGKYSYGIYIYHPFLLSIWAKTVAHLCPDPFVRTAGILALSFAASKVSFDVFESRFLCWKKRFTPGGRQIGDAPSLVSATQMQDGLAAIPTPVSS